LKNYDPAQQQEGRDKEDFLGRTISFDLYRGDFKIKIKPGFFCRTCKDQIINLTKTIKGNNINKYNFNITT